MLDKTGKIYRTGKHRVLSMILVIAMVCSMLPLGIFASAESKSAVPTEKWENSADVSWFDPLDKKDSYILTTPAQLAGFAEIMAGGETYENITVELGADIDLSSSLWKTAGVGSAYAFKGVFDGSGHTIDNMIIRDNYNGSGFIRWMVGATVKNVRFTNVDIEGIKNVGTVCGFSESGSVIANVTVDGQISCTGNWVGGIAGNNTGSVIKNCSVDMTLSTQAGSTYGLLAGWSGNAGSKIEYSTVKGSVSATNYVGGAVGSSNGTAYAGVVSDVTVTSTARDAGTGGLIGWSEKDSLFFCSSSGTVTHEAGTEGGATGGLLGWVYGSRIELCQSSASVFQKAISGSAGGLVGDFVPYSGSVQVPNSLIKESAATGYVEGTDMTSSGGFVGYTTGTIENCYATGTVVTGGQYNSTNIYAYAGAFAGGFNNTKYTDQQIKNCYATGNATAGKATDNGSLRHGITAARFIASTDGINNPETDIINCYYNADSTLTKIGAAHFNVTELGNSRTSAKMKSAGFVSELDNNAGIWNKSDSYPVLKNLAMADYTRVDAAIAKANALNKNDYTDTTAWKTLQDAIAAVVRNKPISERNVVDGYASAILRAIRALTGIPADTWDKYTESFSTANGAGTSAANPILISTAGQLACFAEKINSRISDDSFYEKLYYRLESDIDLSDYTWIPIAEDMGGGSFQAFGGCFDGNNKTITGLYVDQTSTGYAAGLFGNVVGNGVCTIKDLTVEGAVVKSSGDSGNAGILFGRSAGNPTVSGYSTVVTNCTVSGSVTATKKFGGFAGEANWTSFENCSTNVTINGGNMCGGFVGDTFNSSYKKCYALGKLNGGWSLGGFAGVASGSESKISQCTADVDITASDWNVGGFVGYAESENQINNCVAYGDVNSTVTGWWAKTGSFAGTNDAGSIKNSYAAGIITTADSTKNPVAGFIGNSVNGTTTACVYDSEKNPTLHPVYTESSTPGTNDVTGDTTIKTLSGICTDILGGHTKAADWTSVDASNHRKLCTVCGDAAETAAHAPNADDSDCTKAIHCSVCGYEMTAGKTQHTLSDWQSNGTNHWKKCTNTGCTYTEQSAAHTSNSDDGDCSTPIKCSVCDHITTAAQIHNWNTTWTTDGDNHWHTCKNSGCTQIDGKTGHTPNTDDGNCTTAVQCSACHDITTAAQSAHDFTGAWLTDAAQHWHKCTRCDVLETKANHQFAEGTPNPAPTYLADGKRIDTCECGETDEVTLPMLVDSTNPSAEISIGTNKWNSFLNTVTFGLFFKATQSVTITASDEHSGVKSVEYLLSQTIFNTESDITGNWTAVTLNGGKASFNVNPKTKQYIYLKVTDHQDNVTIINSDGIVIYTDSTLETVAAEFNMDVQADIDVTMNLNSNTLKGIRNGNNALGGGAVYTVNGSVVTIKKEYLASALTEDSLTLTFEFNPMGEVFKGTDNAPAMATLTVTKHVHTPNADDGDCTTAITCSVCDHETTAAKTHDWNAAWTTDGDNHWHKCKNSGCTKIKDKTAHTPKADDGDCTTAIACSVCDHETTEAKTHLLSNWQSDGENHWKKCENAGCNHTEQSVAHTPAADDGDCSTPIKCTACQFVTTAAKPHNWNTTWEKDGDNHWHTCKNSGCTQINGKAAHTWDNGKVTAEPTYTEKGEKAFTCTACEQTKTEVLPVRPSKEVIVDPDTETKVEYEDGSVFDDKVELVVIPQSEEEMKKQAENVDKAAKGLTIAGLYDVKLLKNGVAIQPDGKVKITLKLTDEMKAMTDLQVVYIDDDGKVTIIPSEVKDGKIIFVTDHFSYYGVIGKVKTATEEPGNDIPQTGDNSNMLWWFSLMLLSGGTVLFIGKRRKQKSTEV